MPEIAVRNADSPTDLRGEETRRRLIEAAIQLFAVSGFDGVSTRALAQKAEVNLASIPYHFGSKKGLYRAAAEHIAGRCEEEIGPIVNQVERALENGRLSQREASRLLHQLLNSFARVVIGSREADSWSYFIVREQMLPGEAFEILYSRLMRRIHTACAGLVALLIDQPLQNPTVMLRTFTLIGEVLIFRTGRAVMLKRMGWKALSPDRLDFILSVLDENIDAIIAGSKQVRP